MFPFRVGGQFSPQLKAVIVGLALILSIPLSKLIKFSAIRSTRKQIMISTTAILLCMLMLAALKVTEGFIGYTIDKLDFLPMLFFITITFFYVAGISRNSLLIMQNILSSYSLQLHLRTFSIAVTWFLIFGMTKVIPQLLSMVGVGYFYAYMVIFAFIALIFLHKIIPSTLNVAIDNATPRLIEQSCAASTASSETPSTLPLSSSSSLSEIHRIEHI